jgi:uncharacterized protein YecT (DUF1311 family)
MYVSGGYADVHAGGRDVIRRRMVFAVVAYAAIGWTSSAYAADDPPLDCENASSTAELNACAEKALEKVDAELNQVYQRALKSIPDMATDPPYDAKSWEKALRESQRAWIAFRDAECSNHVAMFWTGGSGATVDILGCIEEKTKARIKELKERYEPDENAADGKDTPAR